MSHFGKEIRPVEELFGIVGDDAQPLLVAKRKKKNMVAASRSRRCVELAP